MWRRRSIMYGENMSAPWEEKGRWKREKQKSLEEERYWWFKRGKEVKAPLISRERWTTVTSVPLPPSCRGRGECRVGLHTSLAHTEEPSGGHTCSVHLCSETIFIRAALVWVQPSWWEGRLGTVIIVKWWGVCVQVRAGVQSAFDYLFLKNIGSICR